MKYFIHMKILPLLLVFLGLLISCEDVVDVNLDEGEPRLVIDAALNAFKDGRASAIVKLTTTAPFFDNQVPYVSDASVIVSNENGTLYSFEYIGEGIYYCKNLFPKKDVNYTLTIEYKNETYSATEQLYSVTEIEYVEQRNDGGFTGEDIELKAYFSDPAEEKNFYFFEGLSERGDVLDVYNDEFFDGNTIFGYYLVEDLAPGDEVQFNLYGVNEEFHNFMFILLQQTSDQGSGPFETQPATVRGNIVNENNPENFPLGYFRISEVSTYNYVVQ